MSSRPMPEAERPASGSSIDDVALWYHTLELPGGVVTPGWFDLRGVVDRLPWPDVSGKRCLDVGTYDGFYAFELERRGASEVVATDIASEAEWDLPHVVRQRASEELASYTGDERLGFSVAKEALRSSVQKQIISAYDLGPEQLGTFDVVVCGSLMLHLRDPVAALNAIRSVCRSWFLSVEEISLALTVRFRRRAVAAMRFEATPTQWWVPNAAGHRRMLEVADFGVEKTVGPFAIPFGVSHPRGGSLKVRTRGYLRRVLTGAHGVPHHAVLARAGA